MYITAFCYYHELDNDIGELEWTMYMIRKC